MLSLVSLCVFFRDAGVEGWEASVLLLIYGLYLVVTVAAPAVRARYQEWQHGKEYGRNEPSFVERRREELAAEAAAEVQKTAAGRQVGSQGAAQSSQRARTAQTGAGSGRSLLPAG